MRKKSSYLKKIMVVMKNISTLIAAVGALCLIFFVISSVIDFNRMGMTVGELLLGSFVVLVLGVMGEDLFGNLLYSYEIKNEA